MIKKAIIYILNFLLVICFVTLFLVHITSVTILDKQYVVKCLEQSNYYEKTYYNIQEEFKNYVMQSGLEESILDNLYNQEKVNSDINQVIDSIYENKEIHIEILNLRKTLDNRIKEVLEQNNRKPDAEEELAIQTFEDTIVEVYENGIIYAKEYVENLGDIYQKISNIVSKAELGLIIAGILLLIVIFVISKRKMIRALGIAFLATGVLEIVFKLWIGDKLHHILLLNAAFSESLVYICNNMIQTIFITGIIMSVLGIIVIIASSIPKIKKEKIAEEIKKE
ncbi:MAG: hypothetical protein HFJ28_04150 [Clostridia bacterium]|nr:hypothetical protein [Clostridia bacterium]